jgi:hypothetical protein
MNLYGMNPAVYNSLKEYDLRQSTQQQIRKINNVDTIVSTSALFCC